ncbi:phylloplanin-like [Triticum dicoccoides]|uniref:phylloplanin-like n=1 Tax=Triticum dicoccoides TaxID=85692 RepID=UPI00189015EC|nr:phylloplanin-like [Triticum dicoccoides]
MATKSLLLAALLVLAVSLAPHGAEAAGKQPPLAVISGVVPCSAGNSINVAAVPPFPNAAVQMVCGRDVMASATADRSGTYTMNMGPATSSLLAPLLGNQCKVVVVTPLATCNASLASVTGTLTAPVQLLGIDTGNGNGSGSGSGGLGGLGGLIGLIGQIVGGLLGGILNIIPLPFSVV